MADYHRKGPDGEPVPRDLPDQQAGEDEDPWDAAPDTADEDAPDTDTDVPDTDEAGTGRQDAPRPADAPSDHPVPDEPTG